MKVEDLRKDIQQAESEVENILRKLVNDYGEMEFNIDCKTSYFQGSTNIDPWTSTHIRIDAILK